jgi:tetratricopeptide (TPR) repeat protein
MCFGLSNPLRLAVFAAILLPASRGFTTSDRANAAGQAALEGFAPGCAVELDSVTQGKIGAQGALVVGGIEPGDHYLHVDCPEQPEQELFVSLKPGERITLKPQPPPDPAGALDAAQNRQKLRDLVQQAADERTAGHSEQAIADLRQAAVLDPANADLHRELGITFLLLKDWKRARVEYLEAIKHDPSEAESHNGLGYALEKLGNIAAAANEYRLATRLDPDDGEYREHYFKALATLEAEQDRAKKK